MRNFMYRSDRFHFNFDQNFKTECKTNFDLEKIFKNSGKSILNKNLYVVNESLHNSLLKAEADLYANVYTP